MLDLTDLQALIEMAERAPQSKGETLWLAQLVTRINAQLAEQQKAAAAETPPAPARDTPPAP